MKTTLLLLVLWAIVAYLLFDLLHLYLIYAD